MLFSAPFSPDLPVEKARLRREMRARRNALDERARARASWLACNFLDEWLNDRPEGRIALFLARPFEINLDALARQLLRQGRTVCAPRVEREVGRMRFWRLEDVDETQTGFWQVREPVSGEEVRPDLVLVPGLAFAPCGHRLGTGGGWYDRVLSGIGVRVGVGFAVQIVPAVPVENHDVTLHWVASDAGLIECKTA